jgi:putative transposase
MDEYQSLSHTQWECLYHVVFIPKCRRKTLYAGPRKYLGEVFRQLAGQKESRVEEGQLMIDHVHMMLRIPPKYALSQVVGFIKGKRSKARARSTRRGCTGSASGASGVGTIGSEDCRVRPEEL